MNDTVCGLCPAAPGGRVHAHGADPRPVAGQQLGRRHRGGVLAVGGGEQLANLLALIGAGRGRQYG